MWTKRLCSVVQKVHEDNLLFKFSQNKVMIPKKFLDGVDVANKFLNPFNNFKKVHIVNSEQKTYSALYYVLLQTNYIIVFGPADFMSFNN